MNKKCVLGIYFEWRTVREIYFKTIKKLQKTVFTGFRDSIKNFHFFKYSHFWAQYGHII